MICIRRSIRKGMIASSIVFPPRYSKTAPQWSRFCHEVRELLHRRRTATASGSSRGDAEPSAFLSTPVSGLGNEKVLLRVGVRRMTHLFDVSKHHHSPRP